MKSQSALEYLILVGMALTGLVYLYYVGSQEFAYSKAENSISILLSSIEGNVNRVALMGENSTRSFYGYVPNYIDPSRTFIANNTVNFGVYTLAGTQDMFKVFDFCVRGELPTEEGYYLFNISYYDGCVIISHN